MYTPETKYISKEYRTYLKVSSKNKDLTGSRFNSGLTIENTFGILIKQFYFGGSLCQ